MQVGTETPNIGPSGVMMDCLQLGLPCQMFPLLQDLSGSYLDQTTGKILSGLDFFNKDLISQEKILKDNYGNIKIVDALLSAGQVSIHSSHTYHSSGANLDETPRVGMVVHFCTDRAIRQRITGSNSAYLDQLNDASISPFIFGGGP